MQSVDGQSDTASELEVAEANLEETKTELGLGKVVEGVRAQVFDVFVLYNGIKNEFEVRPEELVKKLLEQAIKEFGPLPNPHTLALYSVKSGQELNDNQTIKDSGITSGDVLLLRPSAVKGGAR